MEQPDPTKHFRLSMAKSIMRIIACIALCFGSYFLAGAWLIIAECIGIAEEFV